ncbi:MAG: hypothetical protein KAS39_03485 [Actinomycetia bacterium]|nr:hypothetical protein [Actinomycetes bacterium]
MTEFKKRKYKSILNKHKFIDSWFWDRYSINPYQGCEHDCIFCDARSHKYNLHPEFEQLIYVKEDPAGMLDLRISRARTLLPDIVVISGVSDSYQPVEKKHKSTRKCLEVLAKHKWPVHIGTKSTLVLRDLDVLSEIAKKTWAAVSFTITTTDQKVADFIEPKAASSKERFEVISKIKKEAPYVQVGVNFIPIVPLLEDSEKNIDSVIKNAKEAGADYVLFSPGMTMRDNQAVWFLRKLSKKFKKLIPQYEELYKFKYNPEIYKGEYVPKRSYNFKIAKMVLKILEKYEMPYRIRRFIPNDYREMNYIIAENLLNKAYYLQMTGKAWSNTHWAGQNIQNLKESIIDVVKRGELAQIRNVDDEIELFIREYLEY